MYYSGEYESPLGTITMASDGDAVCGLWFVGQKYYGAGVLDRAVPDLGLVCLGRLRAWLDAYFAGERPPIADVPIAPVGTEFRHSVWRCLMEVPYGTVTTYGQIARRVESRSPGAVRVAPIAVGGAVGHNPISILIPCHRVVGSTGGLTGYAGGIERKAWLLRHEGAPNG